MTYLDYLDTWVAEQLPVLEGLGDMTYRRSEFDRSNPSAHLLLAYDDTDVELLLWESGEAEFNFGPVGAAVYEHHEIVAIGDLDTLLAKFLATATGDSGGHP